MNKYEYISHEKNKALRQTVQLFMKKCEGTLADRGSLNPVGVDVSMEVEHLFAKTVSVCALT